MKFKSKIGDKPCWVVPSLALGHLFMESAQPFDDWLGKQMFLRVFTKESTSVASREVSLQAENCPPHLNSVSSKTETFL